MNEFVAFMTHFGFPQAQLLAPISVAVQFGCGLLLVLGLFTRTAGAIIAGHFVVALVMVHWAEPFRGWWPALVLVFIGAHFATHGAGRYSLEAWRAARRP
jgi:putative oxidoreductase